MTNWLSTRLDCGNSERPYYFFRRSRLTGMRNYMNYADVNDSCGGLTRLPKTPKAGRTLRRALPAAGAEQGLWNGRVSVRLSVPSIDSSSGVRLVCCWAPCSRRVQAIDRYLLQVPALSSKCVRRHVESRGTRFNTDTHARLTALFRDYHYQKGKTNLDFTEARDSEWQWHQLGHTQVCTSLQTDNHASTPTSQFFTGRMPFLPPNQRHQSTNSTQTCIKYNANLYADGEVSLDDGFWRELDRHTGGPRRVDHEGLCGVDPASDQHRHGIRPFFRRARPATFDWFANNYRSIETNNQLWLITK